jgi:hypothetical protein
MESLVEFYDASLPWETGSDELDVRLFIGDTGSTDYIYGVPVVDDGAPEYKPSILPSHNSFIPEPTTATLSLLALAGLASRRRRK